MPISGSLETAVLSKLTRHLLPFLFLLYIVAYLDRINVGFASLPMQQQLGFNEAVYGRAAGMFFLGYFLFQIPSNLILVRLGARQWIAILMVAWGITSSCLVFVTTPNSFYLLRFCLGLAEAGFFPGVILYLRQWFPAESRARAVAWFMTAAPVAGVIGGPLSGALLVLDRHQGVAGWQWLFLLEGLPAILLGAVVVAYLPSSPATTRWLSHEESAWLVDTLAREHSLSARGTEHIRPFTSGKVWLLAMASFLFNTCGYGVILWLPRLIHGLSGVGSFGVGMLSAIPYLVAAVAMVLAGIHSDRTGERRWHAASFSFLAATALVIAAYSRSAALMIAALSLEVLSAYCMGGPFWALATSLLDESAAAAGIALINAVGNLGGFCGPYVVGVIRLATGEFKAGLFVLAAAMVVSGGLILLASRSQENTRRNRAVLSAATGDR